MSTTSRPPSAEENNVGLNSETTSDLPIASVQPMKRYHKIWKADIKLNGWKSILSMDTKRASAPCGPIKVLDISPTGGINEWHISPPENLDSIEIWIQTNRTELQTRGSTDKSRVIVVSADCGYWTQELVGLEYNIEPRVFRDISFSLRGKGRWPLHDIQLPQYMTGVSPSHLDFSNGWIGKIIVEHETNRNIIVVSAKKKEITIATASALYRAREVPCALTAFPGLEDTLDGYRGHFKIEVDFTEIFTAVLYTWSTSLLSKANEDPLMFLIPILQIENIKLFGKLSELARRLQLSMEKRSEKDTADIWNALVLMKHKGDRAVDCFLAYDSQINNGRTRKQPICKTLLDERSNLMKEVTRSERLARNYQEASIPSKSLTLSNIVIKYSRMSLEENRRMKQGRFIATRSVKPGS